MITQVHYPFSLFGENLDDYLENGWFRSGQVIYTSKILNFDGELFSPVRIRLPLEGYTFRKRLRKLWNKNQKRFRTVVSKAQFSKEQENLYQIHKKKFSGYVAPTLVDSLLEGNPINIYNTYQVAVYDGDQLVAVSFFDLGKTSMASIMGLYLPEYESYSLGFYTMLAEIDFGKNQGFQFYYPGYVIPGYPKFDYKLKIGPVDFYEQEEDEWLPFDQMNPADLPAQKTERKLQEMSELLSEQNIANQLYFYPLYDKNLMGNSPEVQEMQSPFFIKCFSEKSNKILFIEYDLENQIYQMTEYFGFLPPLINVKKLEKHEKYESFRVLLVRQGSVLKISSAQAIVQAL